MIKLKKYRLKLQFYIKYKINNKILPNKFTVWKKLKFKNIKVKTHPFEKKKQNKFNLSNINPSWNWMTCSI